MKEKGKERELVKKDSPKKEHLRTIRLFASLIEKENEKEKEKERKREKEGEREPNMI